MLFQNISTCATVLDEEKAAEVFRENEWCIIARRKHEAYKQVVYGVAEAGPQMSCGAMHSGGQIAYAEVNLLGINKNALHIAVHNFATKVSRHDLRHRRYFQLLIDVLTVHIVHSPHVEYSPWLSCGLRRQVCEVRWIFHVHIKLDFVSLCRFLFHNRVAKWHYLPR